MQILQHAANGPVHKAHKVNTKSVPCHAVEGLQKRVIVQGEAGTGKSTVIQAVNVEITQALGD